MAVYAAHLTRTLSGTPSVFQIVAQEALGSTVKPALRKLVEYLAATYPNKCGWTVDWYDELYLVFDCLLQYHYLKHYAASFSECFYGLLRVPAHISGEFSSGQRLPPRAEVASLLLLTVLPYVRDKVERITQQWREDDEEGRLGKSPAGRVRAAAVRVYAAAHLAAAGARLAQLAAYGSGRARCATPALAALGLLLRDAPAPDHGYTWGDLFHTVFSGQIGSAVVTFPMLGGLVLRAAEYGAFGVQFLRWWQARGSATHQALPPPPPPQLDERALRWSNRCPLCLGAWRAPAVLPVSGLVFCYGCISRQLRARGRCPASGLPAAERSLVRLYLHD
ncbi:peroxisome assembly protein 12 [Pectinophora gossypiella]|uniref:peroxisome assembly protein 12 n=1 Tax=Pectinophora gossypiella TaxID=13191 RepID=UPI00214DFED7|nr:peroxisome assembly protein 12 [Pectinophora gossypiella]